MNCKVTEYTPADYPKGIISFGAGGGFSGEVTEYFLMQNGQLYKMSSHKEGYEKGNSVAMGRTQQMFQNYDFLGLENIEFNYPGNLYYFITHKVGDHEHQIVWGDMGHPVPEEVNTFYRNLNQLIKYSGFRPVPEEKDE